MNFSATFLASGLVVLKAPEPQAPRISLNRTLLRSKILWLASFSSSRMLSILAVSQVWFQLTILWSAL